MNYLNMISELEQLVRQREILIRYEKGDFEGGYCILKDKKILVVNKRLHDVRKASVLAQALSEIGIDGIFVKPAVRNYIDEELAKATKQK